MHCVRPSISNDRRPFRRLRRRGRLRCMSSALTLRCMSSPSPPELGRTADPTRKTAVTWEHGHIPEESAKGRRMWCILMLEECGLLFGNSASVRPGGSCGRRGGGAIGPGSARESVVPVDRDRAAAAHGRVTQRCLNMSKIGNMSEGTLARLDTCYSGPEQDDLRGGAKGENEANGRVVATSPAAWT